LLVEDTVYSTSKVYFVVFCLL